MKMSRILVAGLLSIATIAASNAHVDTCNKGGFSAGLRAGMSLNKAKATLNQTYLKAQSAAMAAALSSLTAPLGQLTVLSNAANTAAAPVNAVADGLAQVTFDVGQALETTEAAETAYVAGTITPTGGTAITTTAGTLGAVLSTTANADDTFATAAQAYFALLSPAQQTAFLGSAACTTNLADLTTAILKPAFEGALQTSVITAETAPDVTAVLGADITTLAYSTAPTTQTDLPTTDTSDITALSTASAAATAGEVEASATGMTQAITVYNALIANANTAFGTTFNNAAATANDVVNGVNAANIYVNNLGGVLTTTTPAGASVTDIANFGSNGVKSKRATGFYIEPYIDYDHLINNSDIVVGCALAFGFEAGGKVKIFANNAVSGAIPVTARRQFAISLMPHVGYKITPDFEMGLEVGAVYNKYTVNTSGMPQILPTMYKQAQGIVGYNTVVAANTAAVNTALGIATIPTNTNNLLMDANESKGNAAAAAQQDKTLGTASQGAYKKHTTLTKVLPMFGIYAKYDMTQQTYLTFGYDLALSTQISSGKKAGLAVKFQSNIFKLGFGYRFGAAS